MQGVLALRRTRLNRNSIPPLVAAVVRQQRELPLRPVLIDSIEHMPQNMRVLGFSFATPELAEVRGEVRRVRQMCGAGLRIIAGGPHPSADPDGTLGLGFDHAFVGEGEKTLPRFLAAVGASDRSLDPVWRSRPGEVRLDDSLHVVPELGLYPFAEIARGCGRACAFCQVPILFGRCMRHRSPEVVAEGVRLSVRAGYHRIRYLTSDAFAYAGGKQRPALAIQALLRAGAKAGATQQMLGSFPSEVRPDHVNDEILQLVRAHCFNRTVVLGAQSGSDRVLRLMRRGHTVEQARQAVMAIVRAGLVPHVDVLFCFPGETPPEREQTVALAAWCLQEAKARVHTHVYLPLPGTSAWPAPPEPLEPTIVHALRRMAAGGRLDGDWEVQHQVGPRILRWRAEGVIRI